MNEKQKSLRMKYKALDVSSIISSYDEMMNSAISRLRRTMKRGRYGKEVDSEEVQKQIAQIRKFFADLRSRKGTAAEIRKVAELMGYSFPSGSREMAITKMEQYAVERIGAFARANM